MTSCFVPCSSCRSFVSICSPHIMPFPSVVALDVFRFPHHDSCFSCPLCGGLACFPDEAVFGMCYGLHCCSYQYRELVAKAHRPLAGPCRLFQQRPKQVINPPTLSRPEPQTCLKESKEEGKAGDGKKGKNEALSMNLRS